MPLNIIRNDITKVKADAIVNTANPLVQVGSGVDSAIYEAAGFDELLAERAKIGPMTPGQAAATGAFGLDAKYIIHTIGPVWEGGTHGEQEAVASCYRNSLEIADELGCQSIAFPLISTGTYEFPKDLALDIAMDEIKSFLEDHDMDVTLVVYDKESFVISTQLYAGVKSFIRDNEVRKRMIRRGVHGSRIDTLSSYGIGSYDAGGFDDFSSPSTSASISWEPPESFEPFEDKDETFQQMLFRIIDTQGLKDPDVYKKANIDRKLFSKIRSNVDYEPSKKTAIALAIALELDLEETQDLLSRAGYTLSTSKPFDLIIRYCIVHGIYDIYQVNCILFDFTNQVLCA
ncbi:MAG: macro domain-containing protein [Bacillota bacterium]|nr:macro domain-containing protein [Bacillota bacterium]